MIMEGAGLLSDTNKAFTEVDASAGKVALLVEEISAASAEQAQGIHLITQAVIDMDKITQQTTAMAEESAAPSAETIRPMLESLPAEI